MRTFLNILFNALWRSERPLVLAGGGLRGSRGLFRNVIERYRLPVVTSLHGIDIPPEKQGFIGTYGNEWANNALMSSDLLLVLGSRLDVRQTGEINSFSQRVIFHVDIDPSELNHRVGCFTLNADLSSFLHNMLVYESDYKASWTIERTPEESFPNRFIASLYSPRVAAYVADVGSNQMWAAQSVPVKNQYFISSGGLGSMGYALPAAIGACIALKAPVVCITGDGGMQVNIQELETIKRNNLPIKIVVLNNHSLGMIRQFQDAYFGSRYKQSVWDYGCPDFVKVARAYGIKAADGAENLPEMWKDDEPFLLNVDIDMHADLKKVMWGDPLNKMT